jgi:hypothetical protein
MAKMTVRIVAVALVNFGLAVGGCSGSDNSGAAAAPGDAASRGANGTAADVCEAVAKQLCDRACACGTNGRCTLVGVVEVDGAIDPSQPLSFGAGSSCETIHAINCPSGGNKTVDYPRCKADLDAAVCRDSNDPSIGRGLSVPRSCVGA